MGKWKDGWKLDDKSVGIEQSVENINTSQNKMHKY